MLQPLQYAPWTSDIELAFYSALASLKINHDKLDSSARKVLGLYEINHRDAPERSTRMQIHGTALTSDEVPRGYYRAEGQIRNFNTIEEYRQVDKTACIEQTARTIWDAIHDGSIYSCPSLLCSFAAICFADLKKYKFTYQFAYPAIHSDPLWRLKVPDDDQTGGITKLSDKETVSLVDAVQTWRYSVDSRQHGFFLAKRLRRAVLEEQWKKGMGEVEEENSDDDGNLKRRPKSARSSSLSELGFLWWIGSLSSYENNFFDNARPEDRFLCFADPSTFPTNPGWMLRNLLILVRQKWKLDEIKVICYRDTHLRRDQPTSLILNLQSAEPVHNITAQDVVQQVSSLQLTIEPALPQSAVGGTKARKSSIPPLPRVTGWERGEGNKMTSRTVDLAAFLDPTRLADQAVDLNLKLIKWRISPSIDLDTIKSTSCLLLGAGTLGSYVSRNLMGWGVRKITFVDNGRVSYSNPVRQPLFEFKDCQAGGAWKATRAAEALKEIYPGVDAQGHVLSVPMPGHPIIGDESKVKQTFEKLQSLIDIHDAVFLLMDTRESRWLPTVMAKAAGKMVINAALGFDTYMIMRHGARALPAVGTNVIRSDDGFNVTTVPSGSEADAVLQAASDPLERPPPSIAAKSSAIDEAEELGCYFCSDVVAPADSLKNATLDQQCTVTRPGAAPIASALAVELLVSLTQHKLRARAPAPPPLTSTAIAAAPPTDTSLPGAHPLGTVPHQLRGYMSTWQTLQIRGKAYDCCAACSPKIVGQYESSGWEFVKRALNEKGFVEEVSGLAEVQRLADEAAKAMEDDEDDMVAFDDDGDGEGELI